MNLWSLMFERWADSECPWPYVGFFFVGSAEMRESRQCSLHILLILVVALLAPRRIGAGCKAIKTKKVSFCVGKRSVRVGRYIVVQVRGIRGDAPPHPILLLPPSLSTSTCRIPVWSSGYDFRVRFPAQETFCLLLGALAYLGIGWRRGEKIQQGPPRRRPW